MTQEPKSGLKFDRNTMTVTSIVLAIVLFLAVNIISNSVFRSAQLDLTNDSLFTVTEGTRDILATLNEPVTLKFYRSEQVQQIPALAAYATRVEELLDRYAGLADGKIKLEKFVPEQFSVEEDQAVGFGIQGVPISSAGEVMYFGLAGTNSTDDEDIIPFFTPSRESFLEYDLSKLVFNLSKPGKTVIAMISSLPIAADQARRFAPWVAYEQAQQFFDIRIIGGNIKRISDDTDIVLLIQPTSLSPTTLYAIDQFVMRGGKALIFADPHVEVNPPPQPQQGQPYRPPAGHALGPLLDAWGIQADPNGVVGDRISAQRVAALSGGRRVVTEYLPWLSLGPVSINRDDVVTQDLERINLIAAGRVGVKDGAGLTMTPL
ncbi:MAG: GldG family protein, partial [Alphaproteobacteria bacterium]|nr:GldG family protein [Alphaproteobacteria bacterium]